MQGRVVATVHDSLEVVCPPEELEEVVRIMHHNMVDAPIMKEVFNIYFDVPFKIDVEVGTSFGDGVEYES